MPQQINLSTPVLLTHKRYFSALTMTRALLVFVVLGGALTAYGAWSLRAATQSIKATLDKQAPELVSLRVAMAPERPGQGASEKELLQELQLARTRLAERSKVFVLSRRGLINPGQGHAAVLHLVAQSIPAQVWVSELASDSGQLEVRGFTQDPAVLNDWVSRLSQSPVLVGQQLARVKVERATAGVTPGAPSSARPVWSFVLASALATPGSGSKP